MTTQFMPPDLDHRGDPAAYLLGAMDDAEAAEFRRHLEACASCQEEVESLRGVVDVLPLAATQLDAPRSLRRRVLTEVRAAAREDRHARTNTLGRRVTWRPAVAGAGVLMAAGAAALAIVLSTNTPGSRLIRATVAWRSAHVVLKVSGGRGQLLARGMPAPPSGKVYEVWVKHGSANPNPTDALFDVTRSGQATVSVPGSLSGQVTVMVTAEPRGGSLVPTSAPVVVAKLRAS
jgi:hypothetical protein